MCGRYLLHATPETLAKLMELTEIPIVPPRYNIAPTQQVLACRQADDGRALVSMRWGLIPSWAEDEKIGYRLINARGDTVATKPSFRSAFKSRRCLIPASGFYEWQAVKGEKKQPHLIRSKDGEPFAFAGIWERWDGGEKPIESCCIVTTDANKTLKPIHDRMPVILDKKDFARWLDPKQAKAEDLAALICPAPEKLLEAVPVGLYVNNPKYDGPKCAEPVSAV
jgi:putative SOS response-associated peptidase YedK